jgi:hypothetical protein
VAVSNEILGTFNFKSKSSSNKGLNYNSEAQKLKNFEMGHVLLAE